MKNEAKIVAAAFVVGGRHLALAEKVAQLERELGHHRAIGNTAAKRARDARTAKIEAAVAAAFKANLPAMQRLLLRDQTSYLIGRLAANPAKYSLTKLPSRKLVHRVVNRLVL